jgi:NADH-quinone oxidoreductase subunit G
MANEQGNKKVTIYIDDVPYQVSPDNNLLAGVLSNKLNLPYFCWHPSMGSVGACRQCAVTQYTDENDTRGRMVMSCMTPISDGMRIGLKDHASEKFREQVIAAMMTNHPHDCPVCAEGGECHLQDMTVMTGHSSRDYRGEKRTFTNQYLGELVGHEMNRCITCYRCVRFYKDYAGGKDFDVFGSRNQVYFGRQKDGVLESQFSGNLVEVCPTGVFTNKLFSAHYTRKWDLQSAPSVCAHCSIGCNTSIGERYGSVRRVMNRYNHDLNGYFLCDRGRFGIGFVNSSKRINRIKGVNTKAGEPSVGMFNEKSFAKVMAQHSDEKFIGIGSARASFEANRFLKYLVGKENFSLGYNNQEMQLSLRHKQLLAQYPQQSLAGIENRVQHGNGEKEHDLVLIIGEVVEQTAPRLALTLRQVLRNAALDKAETIGIKHWQDSAVRTYAGSTRTPLFTLQAQPSEFDQDANGALVLSPSQIVGCVNRLTLMLQDDFSASESVVPIREQQSVEALSVEATAPENENTGSKSTNTEDKFLLLLARAISQAKMPLIVSGLGLKSVELLVAVDDLMACLSQKSHGFSPELTIVAPECNSVGNLYLLNEQTLSIEQIIKRCASSSISTNKEPPSLLILEQDLAQLSKEQSQQLRHFCKTLIVLDHTHNELTAVADVVLPVACVSESNGHFVNFQGRLQRFSSVHVPVKPIMENWHWLGLLAKHLFNQQDVSFSSLSQLQSFFSKRGEPWALQVLTCQYQQKEQASEGTARQTPRSSGRTAMMANQSVHEVKTYNENSQNDILNYSMEGANASSTSNMPYTWSPAWNSNQSIFQHQQEVNGELINAGNENLLNLILSSYFDESSDESVATKLNELWPASSLVVADKLTVIQNIPWFLAEQQTKLLPEFILMFTGNTVSISTTFAKQHDIQTSTILKVTVDEQDIFARAKINNKLSEKIILVSLFELPLSSNNFSLAVENINKATTDEIAEFHQVELNRKQAAQQEKSDVLSRLKKQDQTIPIAFYDANAIKGGTNG